MSVGFFKRGDEERENIKLLSVFPPWNERNGPSSYFFFCFYWEMMFVYASMPAIIMSYLQSEFLIEIQWTFYLFWLTICIVFCHVDTPDVYLPLNLLFKNEKYKLWKFRFIDKFVKNICKYCWQCWPLTWILDFIFITTREYNRLPTLNSKMQTNGKYSLPSS